MRIELDPRRKQFQARGGNGKVRQHGDGQRRVPAPPRNSPCPCGSGKKSKRCHPDGLRPLVRKTEEGTCVVCRKENVTVIPIKHQGLPGWSPRVCFDCVRKPDTLKALLAKAGVDTPAPAYGPNNLRPVVPATYNRRPQVLVGDPEPLTWSHGYLEYAKRHVVNVRCDQGHIGMLAERHVVAADGKVHPSVGCAIDGCGWHAWAVLADWTPPELVTAVEAADAKEFAEEMRADSDRDLKATEETTTP